MSYGLKYRAEFNSLKDSSTFELIIREKGYDGEVIDITLSSDPVIQTWNQGEIKSPINGSSLSINIISDDTDLSIDSFYSDDDERFIIYFNQILPEPINKELPLFVGYILQEESKELMVDYNHVINITATDSLGKLKDINLFDAAQNLGIKLAFNTVIYSLDGKIIIVGTTEYKIVPNTIIKLVNIDEESISGTYDVLDVDYIEMDSTTIITVEQEVPDSTIFEYYVEAYTIPKLIGLFELKEILRLCYLSTGLELDTFNYSKLKPDNELFNNWISSLRLNILTFFESNEWDSCYTVLEKVMSSLNATTFQAEGHWWIMRFNEIRFYTDDIVNFRANKFDYNFKEISYGGSTNQVIPFLRLFEISYGNDIQQGLIKSNVRPNAYVKRIFQFNDLFKPIYNSDFEILGDVVIGPIGYSRTPYITRVDDNTILIDNNENGVENFVSKFFSPKVGDNFAMIISSVYTIFTVSDIAISADNIFIETIETIPTFTPQNIELVYQTIYEYKSIGWNNSTSTGFSRPVNERYIRTVKDFNNEIEIDRFIVLNRSTDLNAYGIPFNELRNTESEPIIVSKDDILKYSFSVAANNYIGSPTFVGFRIELRGIDGLVYTLSQNGRFSIGTGNFLILENLWTIGNIIDCREWIDYEIQSQAIPVDGELYIYLGDYGSVDQELNPGQTYYKNLNLEILTGQNYSKNISGHEYIYGRSDISDRNNLEKNIEMDDTLSSSIPGTLFLNNGSLSDKTKSWSIPGEISGFRLGDIITNELFIQNFTKRYSFEGTLLRLLASNYSSVDDILDYFYLSPNTVFTTPFDGEYGENDKYVIDSLSINYRNCTADFTIEKITAPQTDGVMLEFFGQAGYIYNEFKYLYNKR